MNLITASKGWKDNVMTGIVMNWARQSMLMQRIPFMNVDSFWTKVWQSTSHTEASFRAIGSTYSESVDTFDELQEGIYLMGGRIDIDRALRLPGQKEIDAYAENLVLQSKRYATTFMYYFILGDRSSDPLTFDGIKKRITANGGDQVINGSSLNLGASSGNRHLFLDYMQQSMFEIEDGKPDLIMSSKRGYFTMQRVARREGLLDVTKDNFDARVEMFDGVPIMWAGTKGDQSTEIIVSNEGVGVNETRFYFVKFGERLLTGLQMHEPRRIFDDITDDGVTHRVVFEWPVGLSMFTKKAASMLYSIIPV